MKKIVLYAIAMSSLVMSNIAFANSHHHSHRHHARRSHTHTRKAHYASLDFNDYSVNPQINAPFYQRSEYRKAFALPDSAFQRKQRGMASWYGPGFHRHFAANGRRYNMFALSAASKTLPLNTYAKVTVLRTGRQITVKITDRGPYVGNRIIDLSYGAARQLGIVSRGTAEVEVESLASA